MSSLSPSRAGYRSLLRDGAAQSGRPPWEWKWTTWRIGEGWTLFWIVWIHAWALIGLALRPLPGWPVLVATLAIVWLGGLGTTVCYHRALAHRSLKLNRVVEFALTAFAMFNGSGTPATWTANHRLHHSRVETPDDISSPRIGGFWWSHIRWLYQADQAGVERWAPDLNAPRYLGWIRWQLPVLAASFFIGLCLVPKFGWAAFFWLGPIRLAWALNGQCFVNSIAHMKPGVPEGADSSQNVLWLGVVHSLQGENWHGNHHANPQSVRLGWRWHQIDFGWYAVWLLESLALARNVRRPRPAGS